MAVLENPRRGGQIVLPRRLLELMFDSTPVKNDAQACVMILLRCCYDDEGGEGGLKMGEMYATVSGLSEELLWSKKRTLRLLGQLKRALLLKMSYRNRESSLFTWMNYEETCRLRRREISPKSVGEALMSEREKADFDEFWRLYHQRARLTPHDRFLAMHAWTALTPEERVLAVERMEDYFYSLASMEHVRTGLNYLKYRSFMR